MRISSVNIRRIGGSVKKSYLKELIEKEHIKMMCIQETKRGSSSKEICFAIWVLMKLNGFTTRLKIMQRYSQQI